jgi:hypothetical protein
MVLGAASNSLELRGFGCKGDDSAICCDAPIGKTVVATGRFEPGELVDVSLCEMK